MVNCKNYTEQGGDVTHIGGKLIFDEGGSVKGFPGAANYKPKTTNTAADIRTDLNAVIVALKDAGVMIPDEWDISISSATLHDLPTAQTLANSGHATVTIDGIDITIALDCEVKDLSDADHGEGWGVHKWLGFGVTTGLSSVSGINFDGGSTSITLTQADDTEAHDVGLSAGDFILYIKADDAKYLTGDKSFTLSGKGMAETTFTMKITETKAGEGT